ncbi:type II toxin-antitoxin system PemK/MazF family toxin [Nonomuraea sp. NPDC052116]|uniref:type II toxin-antitoxin system PemK/MazF family toxin n=1 Tax=Nonomuraea sp. NPDC052116 TaxID=3155665 RepID=UPI00343942DE
MKPSQGEIWFTQFDHHPVGCEQGFDRPAMILSGDQFNQSKLGLVVAVPLTSRDRGYPSHIRIDRKGTGLTRTSWAMIEQVRAISPDRLDFFIGSVPDDVVAEAITAFNRML